MNKKMNVLVCVCAVVCLAGCSHNTIVYSDGVGLETTVNPETWTVGLKFVYGKNLTAVVRENTKIKMAGNGKVQSGLSAVATASSADTSSASADGSVEITIAGQCTGYLVDLATADKTLASKIVDKMIADSAKSTSSEALK